MSEHGRQVRASQIVDRETDPSTVLDLLAGEETTYRHCSPHQQVDQARHNRGLTNPGWTFHQQFALLEPGS
jgi:hypothetical protein